SFPAPSGRCENSCPRARCPANLHGSEVAMFARVMTSTARPDAVDTAVAEWPHHIGAFKGKGLITGYLFLDRATNQFLSITIWESEEAQRRNASSPEQVRGRAEFMKHLTGPPVPGTYEIAAIVE